jgi:hypothetical protein
MEISDINTVIDNLYQEELLKMDQAQEMKVINYHHKILDLIYYDAKKYILIHFHVKGPKREDICRSRIFLI